MPDHKKAKKELLKFIEKSQDKRELKRALAVNMYLSGCTLKETANYLGVSFQFVAKWKARYLCEGVQSLKMGYQGSACYLTEKERTKVIHWLKEQRYCTVKELKNYIANHYGKRFRSEQSYYQFLKETGFSFKKSQKTNPRQKASQIHARRHVLKKGVANSKQGNTVKNALLLF